MQQQQQIPQQQASIDANDVMLTLGTDGLAKQFQQHEHKKQHKQEAQYDAKLDCSSSSMLDRLLSYVQVINFEDRLRQHENHIANYISKGGQIKIPQRLYAVMIIEEILALAKHHNIDICRHYATDVDIAYIFNGKYWEEIDGNRLKLFLTSCAIKMGYMELESKTPAFHKLINETFWRNSDFQKISKDNSDTTFINLNNCTLEITAKGINAVKHDKRHFLLYKLDFDYNVEARASIFQQYLDRVLPDQSSQKLLQEAIGYVFVKHLKLEKLTICYGTGSNGKSVFFDVIMALLGADNVTNFSLKHLAEEHNRAMLDGKLLNYGSEINSGIESDILKQLASGEPVQARYKYGNSFIIKQYSRLIFNANELPRATEYTQAYFRRFLLIHFDQTITADEINPELAKIIIATELAGVLNWVIEGAKRLIKNKKFSYCAKSEELLATYKKESDVVALFLEDGGYQPHNNNKRLLKELYGEFKAFCSDNNYQALSNRRFSARLRELGYLIKRYQQGKYNIWMIQTGDY